MPFTTCHPAIVLPLKKLWPRWFSLTGLMAGAMAPDLQYFLLADTTYRGISHSWTGLFRICLPLGIVFAFAFHTLFKYHFVINLPRPLSGWLSGLAATRFQPANLRQKLVLITSVLIGGLSHFFWDSFTHFDGELARQVPWLIEPSSLLGITRHNARWVQHISSLLGALGVVVGLWKLNLIPKPIDNPPQRTARQKAKFWLLGSVCGLVAAGVAVWIYNERYDWHLEMGHNLGLAFSSFGLGSWAGFFWFVCAYSIRRSRLNTQHQA